MLMIFCNRSDCNRRTENQTRWKHTLNQIKRDFNHNFKSLRHAVVPGVCFVVTARVATLGGLLACLTFGLLHLSFLCWSIFTFFRAKFLQSSLFLRTLFPNPFSNTNIKTRPAKIWQSFFSELIDRYVFVPTPWAAQGLWRADPKQRRMTTQE